MTKLLQKNSTISSTPDFLTWFIGFTEGDGCFYTLKTEKGKVSPAFSIKQAEHSVLHWIKSQLGFGHVNRENHLYVYRVSRIQEIETLIHIFNGNLILKKNQQKFLNWLNAYNHTTGNAVSPITCWNPPQIKRKDLKGKTRPRLSVNEIEALRETSPIWNNAWLAGFIDAEGSFLASPQKIKNVVYERFVFSLDQKNQPEILHHIRCLFGDGSSLSESVCEDSNQLHWKFMTSKITNSQFVILYLDRYPLHSKKQNVYRVWKQLLEVVSQNEKKKGQLFDSKTTKKIESLRAQIKKLNKTTTKPTKKTFRRSISIWVTFNDSFRVYFSKTALCYELKIAMKTLNKYLKTGEIYYKEKNEYRFKYTPCTKIFMQN